MEISTRTAGIITPEQLAACGTEDGHQAALFLWARGFGNVDLDLLYAIPNGGSRGDLRRSAAIRGAKLKATGVRKGWPDIGLPVPRQQIEWPSVLGEPLLGVRVHPVIIGYAGLFIELKRPAGAGRSAGKLGDEQEAWHARLRAAGNAVCVAYGWQAAAHSIIAYLAGIEPLPEVWPATGTWPPGCRLSSAHATKAYLSSVQG